jgi:predicted ABC-type transport system involved in lysophospholipase L1 biosynthesis ATPase subunit
MSEPILVARGVTKVFELGRQQVRALRGVDLEVREGEFLALVGPSGSGKTTLLNLVGALDVPTTGELRVLGQPIAELSRRERADLRLRSIGFVFQAFNLLAFLGVAVVAMMSAPAAAQDADEESPSLTVRTSVKATGLVSRSPDALNLFPERTAGESMVRLRVEPEIRASGNTTFNFAYEQRLHYACAPAVRIGVIGILPSEFATPFRIEPLVWRVNESAKGTWRHEIDRANAQVHRRRADLTIRRQAIGWGRGVMFTSIGMFAPFSPLEVDREWRSGVDAVRADVKLTDRSSLDLVGAFGDTLDRSAFAARARGYAGTVDVEVAGGRRGRDLFGGVTSSAAVGDAEVHGEAAAFRVPSGMVHAVVWKAVVGGSYRFPIGAGILAYAEYHYSGFGATHPEEILALLTTPSFVGRFVRGDMQILSRHAVGVTGSYEASPEITYSGQWLHNPGDQSGIVAPAVTYTFNDAVSMLGSVYVPYGRPPEGGVLRSEYGAAPLSGLLQLRCYF